MDVDAWTSITMLEEESFFVPRTYANEEDFPAVFNKIKVFDTYP